MPFDHPLRSKVDNNWFITPKKTGEFFNPDPQAMITDIVRGLHNPGFIDKVMVRVKEDAGGLEKCSVALSGEPVGSLSLCSPGGTARCAAVGIRWKGRRLEG